jgi:hypothetical protein
MRDPVFPESMAMDARLPQSQALALPRGTLSHWFARFGFGLAAEPPGDEPSVDGATIMARKKDLRALRKEASLRAEKPPLPFS